MDEYNLLIHLHPLKLTRHHQALAPSDQLLRLTVAATAPPIPIDYDPASLLVKELQRHFKDAALFFHDRFGGHVVAVLYKEVADRTFDVSLAGPFQPSLKSSKRVRVSREALIEGIERLGDDLIDRVEVQRE